MANDLSAAAREFARSHGAGEVAGILLAGRRELEMPTPGSLLGSRTKRMRSVERRSRKVEQCTSIPADGSDALGATSTKPRVTPKLAEFP
jgi:hypothetical protein